MLYTIPVSYLAVSVSRNYNSLSFTLSEGCTHPEPTVTIPFKLIITPLELFTTLSKLPYPTLTCLRASKAPLNGF